MSPLQTAFLARARADLALPADVSLADAIRGNAVRDRLHGLIAERCAPRSPDTDVVPVSKSSLRRLLLGETSLAKAKTNTRDAIARYLGYEDFADFERARAVEETAPAPAAPVRRSYATVALVAVALVALAGVGYGVLVSDRPPRATAAGPEPPPADTAFATAVHDLVRGYNRAEFALYEALPELSDTARVLDYAWPDGESYPYVREIALNHAAEGITLDARRSSRQLIDCRIVSRADSTCLVETVEQWTLFWRKPDGSAVKYDEVNEQRYGLRERDGDWKVFANGYTGTNTVTGPGLD